MTHSLLLRLSPRFCWLVLRFACAALIEPLANLLPRTFLSLSFLSEYLFMHFISLVIHCLLFVLCFIDLIIHSFIPFHCTIFIPRFMPASIQPVGPNQKRCFGEKFPVFGALKASPSHSFHWFCSLDGPRNSCWDWI